jgi:GNAT superfamily N-acetyltransferase
MEIRELTNDLEKANIAKMILEGLPEWFGIAEAREGYVRDSAGKLFFAAFREQSPVGFLYLKETGKDTAELAVMGVLEQYHRSGIGKALFAQAKAVARQRGYAFLQVKTVRMGEYACYDATNRFYLALGFKEFEVFPFLWDEKNPCQIYVMSLE